MTSPSTPPPYNPAPYIVASSGLTVEQLTAQFESFKDSLRYVDVAPELVFERILGNLSTAVPGPEGGQGRGDQQLSTLVPTGAGVLHDNLATAISEVSTSDRHSIPNGSAGRSPELPATVLRFTSYSSYGVQVNCSSSNDGLYDDECSWVNPCSAISGAWFGGSPISGAQFGSYNTARESRGIPLQREIERAITFTTPFATAPQVLVWFTGLDICYDQISRVCTSIIRPSTTGFVLCISTAGDAILYSAGVSWLAYDNNHNNNARVDHEQFTVFAHSLCQMSGAHDQVFRGRVKDRDKTLVVVNKVAISGKMQWPLVLSPTSIGTGLIYWNLISSATGSACCVLGGELILA